jgi:hypothetical protein
MPSGKKSRLLDRMTFLLAGVLVATVVSGLGVVFILQQGIGLQRIVPVDRTQDADQYHREVFNPADLPKLREQLHAEGITKLGGEEQVLATLRWVMSQTAKVEHNSAEGGWAVLQSIRQGAGMLCASTAELFRDALLAVDVPARKVFLIRDVFGGDSHATVEAWVGGKWRLYDPTFHVALKSVDSGDRLGILDAQRWFVEGVGKSVEFEFLGEVKYPVRLERYYIRYEALLNNVFIELRRGAPWLRYVPWARPSVGPVWGYPESNSAKVRTRHYDVYTWLYYFSIVGAPSLAIALVFGIVGLRVANKRLK